MLLLPLSKDLWCCLSEWCYDKENSFDVCCYSGWDSPSQSKVRKQKKLCIEMLQIKKYWCNPILWWHFYLHAFFICACISFICSCTSCYFQCFLVVCSFFFCLYPVLMVRLNRRVTENLHNHLFHCFIIVFELFLCCTLQLKWQFWWFFGSKSCSSHFILSLNC